MTSVVVAATLAAVVVATLIVVAAKSAAAVAEMSAAAVAETSVAVVVATLIDVATLNDVAVATLIGKWRAVESIDASAVGRSSAKPTGDSAGPSSEKRTDCAPAEGEEQGRSP